MDLEKEVDKVLSGYAIRDSYVTSFAVYDGHCRNFDTLCSEGIKKEGNHPRLYACPKEAIIAYINELHRYIKNYAGNRVHFRSRPILEQSPNSAGWYVHSRLFIANYWYENPEEIYDAKVTEEMSNYLKCGWRTVNKGPNPENKSGFRATGHRILLIPEEVEKKTASGILLAEKTVHAEEQRAVIATVLEIGPDAWRDKSTDYCELGDRVLIGQYVGKFHTSPVDGKTYRFVSDLDIISPLPKVEV